MRERRFLHPSESGYAETVGGRTLLLTMLFGPIYAASKDAWGAAALLLGCWLLLGCVFVYAADDEAILEALAAWLFCQFLLALLAQPMIARGYLKRGWREET